ncbi:hypothetical protein YTPLAS18_24140 [Nitrospira sp.]|nr:hypothetical protein YTPLAS18_24140 [Nitrospira sp.]
MSEGEATGFRRSIETYLRALREAVGHVVPRVRFFREVYERMTATKELPAPVRSVLFLCKGNICRSPLAEVYFAHKARKEGQLLTVKSAGIETTPGKPAHNHARDVARENGISLERHTTTPLYHELLQSADLVFVMEVSQKDRVARLYPQERRKVYVLGHFCAEGSLDIDDPYSGQPDDFKQCFERIKESCDRVIDEIIEQRRRVGAETNVSSETNVKAG